MQDGSDVIKGYAIKDYVTRGQLEDAGRERERERERERKGGRGRGRGGETMR